MGWPMSIIALILVLLLVLACASFPIRQVSFAPDNNLKSTETPILVFWKKSRNYLSSTSTFAPATATINNTFIHSFNSTFLLLRNTLSGNHSIVCVRQLSISSFITASRLSSPLSAIRILRALTILHSPLLLQRAHE